VGEFGDAGGRCGWGGFLEKFFPKEWENVCVFFTDGAENDGVIVEVISAALVIPLVAIEVVAEFAVILGDRQIGYLTSGEEGNFRFLGGCFLEVFAEAHCLRHSLCYGLGHFAWLLGCLLNCFLRGEEV
jgi:hypothetical protein